MPKFTCACPPPPNGQHSKDYVDDYIAEFSSPSVCNRTPKLLPKAAVFGTHSCLGKDGFMKIAILALGKPAFCLHKHHLRMPPIVWKYGGALIDLCTVI